jgi:peptidyl-prolyl cis-trans isomerase B (cyclophilin B)
MVLTCQ